MFRLLFALLLPLSASALTIDSAYTRYMVTGNFQRLAEFFFGEERAGNRVIVRSDPSIRDGLYFVIDLDGPSAGSPPLKLVVQTIPQTERRAQVFEFALPTQALGRTVYAGLTGAAWPSPEVEPLAWRVSVVDSTGQELAEAHSFLWEMPE